ncbi:hypothetical protein E1176_05935 [Fulvivirga sp. RKSG066]|uniref:hypothetical protein n=1 Tax=Fulvivirga aurantia TaxID=2529383 RepID=UPI0012BD3EEF|nr:hypothetical protein [Fulvivirga aurantia]MTI20553.1 hypothetical protein [Fulvivirga aurantia]
MFKKHYLSSNFIYTVEIAIALGFVLLPLFVTFPYKINLYLAWEGAYRISIGQMPFKDFGMPLGYGFWLIPAMFFKLFGPLMSSLIKAQAFINLLSVLCVHIIFKTFDIKPALRTIGVLFFCLSFVFIHFWPWYNHTVFFYELLALSFLLSALVKKGKHYYVKIVAASLFIFLSIFTKQDIGGLAFLLALSLILVDAIFDKSVKGLLIFGVSFLVISICFITPLLKYDFAYWFNFGQFPHGTRISVLDLLDTIFDETSLVFRIYLFAILVYIVYEWQNGNGLLKWNKKELLFLTFTLGIVVQPLIAQLTTYIPENSHFYYHAFVLVFFLNKVKTIEYAKTQIFIPALLLIFILWPQDYWRYIKRVAASSLNITQKVDYNYVGKKTWKLPDPSAPSSDRSDWVKSPLRTLDNVKLPKETIEGMKRLVSKYSNKPNLKVLNMSELPQLAYEIGYEPLKGSKQPLWFHRNVAFFEREVEKTCDAIANGEYDLVLFEVIPMLNRFYPPSVRECLQENYNLEDTFLAPRIPDDSFIEVYSPKD